MNLRGWAKAVTLEQPVEVPPASEPLPDLKTQVRDLEALASELAKGGHDVAEASRILDEVRTRMLPDDGSISCNEKLNQVRGLLYSAPGKLRFSNTVWPYLLMAYELGVLMVWVWLLFDHRIGLDEALSNSHWSMFLSTFVGFIAGSIGACTFAIYGLYSHLIYRNVYPGYLAWYVARPAVGGVMGAFIGIIGSIVLGGIGAMGAGANAFAIGVSFLAGSNEKFSAEMIERFTSKVLGIDDKSKGQKPAKR